MIRKLIAGSLLATSLCLASSAMAAPPQIDRSQAETAIEKLDGRAVWSAFMSTPTLVTGLRVAVEGKTQRERARTFLTRWSSSLLSLDMSDLVFAGTESAADRTSIRFQQFHEGLPVSGRFVLVTLTDDGTVLSVSNDTQRIASVEAGDVDEAAARSIAFRAAHPRMTPEAAELVAGDKMADIVVKTTKAMRVVVADPGAAMEVWKVKVKSHPVLGNKTVLVSTKSGTVIGITNNIQH